MKVEYRVIWKREGCRAKSRRSQGLASAERRVGLLTSAEPWKFLRDTKGKGPDAPYCCPGTSYECGCGGITVREWCDEQRRDLPALEYVRIESREVGAWGARAVESGGRQHRTEK